MNTKIIVTLFTALLSAAGFAAEWKNPDEQPVEGTQGTAPPPPRVVAPAPVPAVQPVQTVLLEGELGLEAQWSCNLEQVYNDKGSGGEQDVWIFLPAAASGYRIIGGYAQGNHHAPSSCVLTVKPLNQESAALLQPPAGWRQIWNDRNSGARADGSIWHPVSGNNEYVCLGSVANQGYGQPFVQQYACVHQCLVETIPVPGYIWSDRGTGASQDVSLYRLLNSHSFYAVPSHAKPAQLQDLRRELVCKF